MSIIMTSRKYVYVIFIFTNFVVILRLYTPHLLLTKINIVIQLLFSIVILEADCERRYKTVNGKNTNCDKYILFN